MTVTEAYDCKAALINRLQSFTGKGFPLQGVQVEYAWTGRTVGLELVYGGGLRFTRESAGHDGTRELWLETARIGLYVRVRKTGGTVADTDQRCKQIATELETLLQEEPRLPGNYDYVAIEGGTGDYMAEDQAVTSVLAYQVIFQYYID